MRIPYALTLLLVSMVALVTLSAAGYAEPPAPDGQPEDIREDVQPQSPDAPNDFVHNEDVIVDGRLCAGFECANEEPFGVETIRVKASNTFIKFIDTSDLPDYPTNDWTLMVNSNSINGGDYMAFRDDTANRIPFRVNAGAPDHALYVTSSGNIGMGTDSPESLLHLQTLSQPSLTIEATGVGGAGAAKYDIRVTEAGLSIRNRLNFRTPLSLASQAPTGSINVDALGNLGVGASTVDAPLHVQRSDGTARLHVDEKSGTAAERTLGLFTNKGPLNLQLDNTDVNRQWSMGVRSGGDFRIQSNQAAGGVINFLMNLDGALTLSGNLTVGSCSGCTAIRSAGDQLASLSGLTFRRWTTRDAVEHFGPDPAAFHRLTGLGAGPDGIAPLDVASVALASTQNLEARILSLEAENASLKARLAALEAALGVENSERIYLPSAGR